MKKHILSIFLSFGTFLHSWEENAFPYASLNVGTVTPNAIPAIGLGIGYRHIFGLSALDINGNVLYPFDKETKPFGCPMVQGAYLIYFEKWNGPYL